MPFFSPFFFICFPNRESTPNSSHKGYHKYTNKAEARGNNQHILSTVFQGADVKKCNAFRPITPPQHPLDPTLHFMVTAFNRDSGLRRRLLAQGASPNICLVEWAVCGGKIHTSCFPSKTYQPSQGAVVFGPLFSRNLVPCPFLQALPTPETS